MTKKTKNTNTTRAADTRKREKKPAIYKPPQELEIPEEVVKMYEAQGMKLRWLRYRLGGEEDYRNLGLREREGYILIHPSEVDEFMGDIIDVHESEKRGKSFVTVGDVALAKIPVELAESRQDFYEDMARGQEQALDDELARNNSEHMPFISGNRSSTSTGKQSRFQ